MATKKNRTNGTKIEKVNASAIDLASVNVSAPDGIGLSDGTMSVDGGALSAPAVGGGVRSGKGRNNSSDQLDTAIEMDVKENAEKEQKKEDTLYNKVVARFLAPEFDKNSFAASLIAEGLEFTAIVERVNAARREWDNNHPAPACSTALVLDVFKKEYEKEFTELVGVAPDGVAPSDVRIYSRPAGCLVSRPLAPDASASAIVRAVLSYRWKVKDDDEMKKRARARRNEYYSGLSMAARNGLDLGLSDDEIMKDFERRLMHARHEMDTDTARLRSSFLKYRKQLDDAIARLVAVCPAVAVARLGSSDDVFVLPENITKEEKSVCGVEFAKIRNIRRNMTAINAALWGVNVAV